MKILASGNFPQNFRVGDEVNPERSDAVSAQTLLGDRSLWFRNGYDNSDGWTSACTAQGIIKNVLTSNRDNGQHGQTPPECGVLVRLTDGRQRLTAAFLGSSLRDMGGRPVHMLGVLVDMPLGPAEVTGILKMHMSWDGIVEPSKIIIGEGILDVTGLCEIDHREASQYVASTAQEMLGLPSTPAIQ